MGQRCAHLGERLGDERELGEDMGVRRSGRGEKGNTHIRMQGTNLYETRLPKSI